MNCIGVIANCRKPDAPAVARQLAAAAADRGMTLLTCDETADLLPDSARVSLQEFIQAAEAVLVMGGDGTMLHAVRMVAGARVPLMGINLGSLGFLTSVTQTQITQAVAALADDRVERVSRTMLEAAITRQGQPMGSYHALNDVVIGWGYSSRIITLDLIIDARPVMTARCDGLVLSTPTGSTGHSLSAGGPIIYPETPVYLVNVVCPHTLSDRPFVLPDHIALDVKVTETSKEILLAVDGQDQMTLRQDDEIRVRKSSHRVELLNLQGHCYFELLRHKLHWRGSST